MSERPRAILLTGTVASGKTVVAAEIGWQLAAREVPVAIVDLDWLAWVYFGPDHESERIDELIAANLAATWPNYRAAGIGHFVLARAVVRRATLEGVTAAMPAAEIKVIRLTASPGTVEARLRRRDSGRELADHLNEMDKLTLMVEAAALEGPTVANDGREVDETAAEVLRVAGWVP